MRVWPLRPHSLQGGVFASSASAATTYDSGDDFKAGDFISSEPVKLTVTKYTSFNPGNPNETGSDQDANKVDKADKPEPGVTFSLTHIVAASGHTESEFTNDNSNKAWQLTSGTETVGTGNDAKTYSNVFYGTTDSTGVISQWYKASDWDTTNNKPKTETPAVVPVSSLPNVHQYYVLHQVNNPTIPKGGTEADAAYATSQDSVFDLPYRATNDLGTQDANHKENTQDGFVYNLHVYPKNVSNTHIQKKVYEINGSQSTRGAVKVGDKVTYDLIFRFNGFSRPSDDNDTSHVYLSDLANASDTKPWVRLVDRFSDRLLTNPTVDYVGFSYTDASGKPAQITINSDLYSETYQRPLKSPDTLTSTGDPSGTPMFSGSVGSEQGVNYYQWDLDSAHLKDFNIKGAVDAGGSNPIFEARMTFTLTSDDQESNLPGALVNDFAASFRGQKNPEHVRTHTPSAGFNFGKVDTKNKGVDGAVFRLVKHGDKVGTHFLASDGQYYNDAGVNSVAGQPNKPADVSFVEATSNNKGIVTFQNLPIFTRSSDGTAAWINADDAKYDVIEYKAPAGYRRITEIFGTVSFTGKIQGYVRAHQTPNDLADGTYITHDSTPTLNFGKQGTTLTGDNVISLPVNYPGETGTITNALVNYKNGEQPPIHLPLTGGMGIVLLLVIGAVIMAIVIIERKRREANARR